EIGGFEMQEKGLVAVANPSEFMLDGKPEGASGSIVSCSMEGTRPILFEIQALVCRTNFGFPRRQANGTDFNRVNLLMAVLEKRVGLQMSDCDAYVNLAGGMKIVEPAIDLGIAMAVASSFKNRPIDDKMAAFGEIGLSGEVRSVSMIGQRIQEAARLGYTTCMIPKVCENQLKNVKDVKIIGVSSVQDAISFCLN
ncbi:MAG: DNA repair protein RadA, partial [Lachnospiraceae bacterium]|nr:DNA repair protein RadA [Lachnospiraceae bacterium]